MLCSSTIDQAITIGCIQGRHDENDVNAVAIYATTLATTLASMGSPSIIEKKSQLGKIQEVRTISL